MHSTRGMRERQAHRDRRHAHKGRRGVQTCGQSQQDQALAHLLLKREAGIFPAIFVKEKNMWPPHFPTNCRAGRPRTMLRLLVLVLSLHCAASFRQVIASRHKHCSGTALAALVQAHRSSVTWIINDTRHNKLSPGHASASRWPCTWLASFFQGALPKLSSLSLCRCLFSEAAAA